VRQNQRRGFNSAIIEGFGHTSGEIISILRPQVWELGHIQSIQRAL
jgi:hypothetical protein